LDDGLPSKVEIDIWYILVNDDGSSFQGSLSFPTTVSCNANIATFLKQVKSDNDLAMVDASDLKVYLKKEDLGGEPLEVDESVNSLGAAGATKKDALVVLVPDMNMIIQPPPHAEALLHGSNEVPSSAAENQDLDDISLRLKSFMKAKLVNGCIVSDNNASS
jgi:hypothetical protein